MDAREKERLLGEEQFLELYQDLCRLAHLEMQRQGPGHTLETAALVNEAWLRLGGRECAWSDREHFLKSACSAMRSVLIDHARSKLAVKRGGGTQARSHLDELTERLEQQSGNLVELNDLLEELEAVDPRAVRMVELRFFGGLTMTDVARVLGVSRRQAYRDWYAVRALLRRALS